MRKKISILICIITFLTLFAQFNISFAKPLTENTEANKLKLNQYYQLRTNNLRHKLSLYRDIQIEDPAFVDIFLFKKLGILPKDDYFHPNEIIEINDFLFWYMKLFEPRKIKYSYSKILKMDEKKKALTMRQLKTRLKYKSRKLIENLENDFLTISDAEQFMEIKNSDINNKKPLTRIAALNLFLKRLEGTKQFKDLKNKYINYQYPKFSKSNPPKITVSKKYLELNGKPLKGLFVNWMDHLPSLSKQEIKKKIEEMKELNIIGVTLEIGWDEIEETEDKYKYPKYFENILSQLSKEGLYVHLLISPHYTPTWVFEKYDTDIRMVDNFGNYQDEGEYATYSYNSPAVTDQIEFQKKAVSHYSKFPNIISFLLGNEQSYGRTHDLDYSVWMERAYSDWLQSLGKEIHPIPKDPTDSNYILFRRFRQIAVNSYFNKVYKDVKPVQKRVPISFKFIPYENTSALAPQYGLHLSPLELKMDFLAVDIYGYTPNVFSLINSFDLPKIVIETNLPGDWSSESMFKYLIINYLNGIPLQSIFAWVSGEFENALFHNDNSPCDKVEGIKKASQIIQILDMPENHFFSSAIIAPTHGINIEGYDYEKYQYKIDNKIDDIFEKTSVFPLLLWSDDIFQDDLNIFDKKWHSSYFEKFDKVYLIDSPYDYPENLDVYGEKFEKI